jgi:hypothetical protein
MVEEDMVNCTSDNYGEFQFEFKGWTAAPSVPVFKRSNYRSK